MTADNLINQLDQNRRMMRKCEHGCIPTLDYEPGVTFGGCDHRSIAIPDWAPFDLRKQWNDATVKPSKR